MRAGLLRHLVSIETYTESQDAYGQITKDWSEDSTRHASIEPLSGKELVDAQQVHPEVSHLIRLRYFTELTTDDRIKLGSRIFEPLSVINVGERKKTLDVMAVERV